MILLRLESLKYMLSLQETNSISKTADKFLISHQAVSKTIRILESELSVTLLERSSKGVFLTPAGKRFCEFAQTVLNEESNLIEDIKRYCVKKQPSIKGDLTIYAVPRYITPSFLKFIEKMHSAYPKLNLFLHNSTLEHIFEKLSFDADTICLFTLGYNDTLLSTPFPEEFKAFINEKNLSFQVLSQKPLFACVHQKSPLANKEIMSLQDVAHNPFVAFSYAFYKGEIAPQFTIDSFEQQKNIIKQGSAFGRYTQQEINEFFSSQYKKLDLENPPMLLFMAMYLDPQPKITNFLDLLIQNVKF